MNAVAAEVGVAYRLKVKNGALVLDRRRREPIVLAPTYKDAFSADGVLYRFTRAGAGDGDVGRCRTHP